jgi:hypothetical protein
VNDVFSAVDVNKDGVISLEEFKQAIAQHKLLVSPTTSPPSSFAEETASKQDRVEQLLEQLSLSKYSHVFKQAEVRIRFVDGRGQWF